MDYLNYDIRKAYIKDFYVNLKINHTETMPNVPHLHDPKLHGKPERVIFNFEIGYKYKPVNETSTIDEVFEYSFICRKLLDLQDDVHSCISEYLLENICKSKFRKIRCNY